MKYEKFLTLTLTLQKKSRELDQLYKNNVDLINFTDDYAKVISILIEEIYGKSGLDWFEWFCWENNFGQGGLNANDKDGNPICYSHESLWNFLEGDRKSNKKTNKKTKK
jgi:hypothetical protein